MRSRVSGRAARGIFTMATIVQTRPNHYLTLGADPGSERRRDCGSLCARDHPVAGPRVRRHDPGQHRYEALRDPARRKAYDESIGVRREPGAVHLPRAVSFRSSAHFISGPPPIEPKADLRRRPSRPSRSQRHPRQPRPNCRPSRGSRRSSPPRCAAPSRRRRLPHRRAPNRRFRASCERRLRRWRMRTRMRLGSIGSGRPSSSARSSGRSLWSAPGPGSKRAMTPNRRSPPLPSRCRKPWGRGRWLRRKTAAEPGNAVRAASIFARLRHAGRGPPLARAEASRAGRRLRRSGRAFPNGPFEQIAEAGAVEAALGPHRGRAGPDCFREPAVVQGVDRTHDRAHRLSVRPGRIDQPCIGERVQGDLHVGRQLSRRADQRPLSLQAALRGCVD